MAKEVAEVVYVVTCFQNIIGVYASLENATQAVKESVAKNRPAQLTTCQVL